MRCSLDLQSAGKSHSARIYSIDRACFSLAFHEHFSPLFCSLVPNVRDCSTFLSRKKWNRKAEAWEMTKQMKANSHMGLSGIRNILHESSDYRS
jgi:hypothetical protein